MLDAAYRADIVPPHLHGKTQHKTLQARLSEDILKNKRNSVFYRTEPGYFFLTEFQSDPLIPEKFRVPFPARRRTRDLSRGPILAMLNSPNIDCGEGDRWLDEAIAKGLLLYADPKDASPDIVFLWTFAMVVRGDQVLSYRVGRYRDDRDSFANKRTVGFSNVVHADYRTFFNQDDYGIMESATTAVLTDLDISNSFEIFNGDGVRPTIQSVCVSHQHGKSPAYVAFIRLTCPEWFEPTSRRLSLNDLRWLDVTTTPNHLEDFDPWSQVALERRYAQAV
jgi:hypothetical protein